MTKEPKKPDDPNQVPGQQFTSTGAPVDTRFAQSPAPATPAAKAEEDAAQQRSSKSEAPDKSKDKDDEENGDDPKGSKKRR